MSTIRDVARGEAQKYGWGLILIYRDELKKVMEKIINEKGSLDVLEIGCYKGMLEGWIESNFPKDRYKWSYTGIDILGPFPEWDGKNCHVMNAESLEFPPGSFDLVVMIEVLEHIVDYFKALYEAYRVLRSGGGIFIQSVICNDHNALLDKTHFHVLHPVTLSRLLSWIGFKDIEYRSGGNFAIWGFKR